MSLLRDTQLNTLAHAYSSRHATRVMMEDAEVLSLHATASGLAVLAYAPAEFVARVLDSPLPAFTDETLTHPDRIRAALPEIRTAGVAESIGGFEADVHSHAAPVFGPDQTPLGALAVAAPVGRMAPGQTALIRRAVQSAARDLTRRTGGNCPAGYPQAEAT
jgi:DNA-binding IclR family transcriptional regulator